MPLDYSKLISDKNVYPEPTPPPPLPQAGETFIDPTFNTTILRVTDQDDGIDSHNAYASWPSLNSDNSKLFYLSGTGNVGMLCDFDPQTMKISDKRPIFTTSPPGGGWPNAEDAIWSGVDPDVIYCRTGLHVLSLNVRTNTYTLVKDFAGVQAVSLAQMAKTPDDDVFAFHLKAGEADNYKNVGYLAWRRSTGFLYVSYTLPVDEVQIDKTGRYLLVMTGEQGAGVVEGRVVDLQIGTIENWLDNAPDFCPSHRDVGRGTVLGADNWNNQLTFRNLATPHQFITALGFGNDWSQSNHISMLGEEEWGLVSTFAVSPTPPPNKPFHNELFLVATNGSTEVRRICHHHSNWLTNRNYWDSPRACLSFDGRFSVVTSNWGDLTRRDVFVVRLVEPEVRAAGLSDQLRRLADEYDAGRVR